MTHKFIIHILLTSFMLSVFGKLKQKTYVEVECRLSDIKSMIGGQDYTVDEMRGIHFTHETRD